MGSGTPMLATVFAPLVLVPFALAQGPEHVRLIWTTSPQTSVIVAWSTSGPGEAHAVSFGLRPGEAGLPELTRRVASSRDGGYEDDDDLYYHHAALSGLEPGTDYSFAVDSDGRRSPIYYFRTAPAAGFGFSILSGGDSRSDPKMRREMNRRMAALVEADPTILALAHGGDYVFDGQSKSQWHQWLDDHEFTIGDDGRVLPVIPARGNHEAWGPLFDEVFAFPGGGLGQNYFVTDLSASVRLVTLNSEIPAGGDQRDFLARALADTNATWRVVQYHRPIWPAVKSPAHMKPHWQPLFEQHGVQLVLESDGHVLKRTVPILGDTQDEQGVVYIGEGGLGVKLRTPREAWYLSEPGTASSNYHVWRARFEAGSIALTAFGVDGQELDSSVIELRAESK